MDVHSPFERVPFGDVLPGQIVAVEAEQKTTVAIATLVGGRQVGFLLLEGISAGRIKYLFSGTVLRFKDPVLLALRYESNSLSWSKPAGDILVAVSGEETYFMFEDHGRYHAMNVKTGVMSNPPAEPLYIGKWAIQSELQAELVLESQPKT